MNDHDLNKELDNMLFSVEQDLDIGVSDERLHKEIDSVHFLEEKVSHRRINITPTPVRRHIPNSLINWGVIALAVGALIWFTLYVI